FYGLPNNIFGQLLQTHAHAFSKHRTDIAVGLRVMVVNMLRYAAGKNDMLDLFETAIVNKRRRYHKTFRHRRRGSLLDYFKQDLGHIGAEILFLLVGYLLAKLHGMA